MPKTNSVVVTKENLMKKRNVVESNNMIDVYMNLSSEAQKIFYTTIAMIGKDDQNFLGYTFKSRDLKALFRSTSNSFNERIKNAAQELMKSHLVIELPDGSFSMFSITREISYSAKTKELYIELEEKLSKFFLQLQTNFTKIPLSFFLDLKKPNSMRILNLIVSKWNIAISHVLMRNRVDFSHKFDFEVKKLRHMFYYGVETTSTDFKNIHARILKPAIKEINEKSIFHVDMSINLGTWNKAESVSFNIRYNERGKTLQLQSGGFPELTYLDWSEGRKICKYFKEVFEIPEKQIIVLHDKYTDHELKAAYLSMYEYLQEYSGTHYWEPPIDEEERGVIKVPIAFLKSTLKNRSYEDLEHLEIESGSKKLTEKSKKLIDEYFDQEYPFKWEEN